MGLISRVSSRTYRFYKIKMTTELEQYQIQLEQVELALSQDQGNEELKALKEDLLQVIELAQDLEEAEKQEKSKKLAEKTETKDTERDKLVNKWQPGKKVLAPWSKDGHFYRAVVDEVLPGSTTVAVTFPDYGEKDLCKLEDLLPDDLAKEDPKDAGGKLESHLKKTGRKDWLTAEKEKRAFKKEKKAAKLKAQIEMGENSKKGWQNFQKTKKSNSGRVGKVGKKDKKQSMFATPDNWKSAVWGSEQKKTEAQKAATYNARSLIPKQF